MLSYYRSNKGYKGISACYDDLRKMQLSIKEQGKIIKRIISIERTLKDVRIGPSKDQLIDPYKFKGLCTYISLK